MMKSLLALSACLVMTTAFACQEEAQFMGRITAADCADEINPSVKLNFSMYNESMVCPLSKESASQEYIQLHNVIECYELIGQSISGVIIRNADGKLELDN